MIRRLVPFVLLCSLSLPVAHAGRRTPDVVEDALAFAITDRSKAIQLLEDALEAGPPNRYLDTITVHAGEQRRLAGDSDAAHAWFTAVLSRTERGSDADAARLGLTLLQSGGELTPKVRKLLAEIPEKNGLDTQNADRFYLLALAADKNDKPGVLGQHKAKSLEYAAEDDQVLARLEAAFEALEAGEEPPPQLGGDGEGDGSGPRGNPTLDKADAALANGDKDQARKLANKVANSSDPLDQKAAAYLLRRIDAPAPNPRKVAVLLPLDGKYGAVGKQVKQALEFGHREGGSPFSLEFVDSGATPESAVAALEKAVIDEGAIAVVGPLLSDETDPVVEAAEALRVPLISLSQSLEDASDKQWVLQAMMSTGDQVRALLEHTMGAEEMDAFAVFAPQNTYGERVVELFEAEVTERGGKITVQKFYDPAATDLIPFAKDLGRKDYDARAREFYDLKKEAEEKGGNPDRVVLPPIVDFDAIFLPDNASRVPLAAAALAYEEFPMGDFLPTKESPTIPLLGLSGWNNHNLVGTGGPYARRSFFTDAFLNEAPVEEPPWTQPAEQAAFVEAYRSSTQRTPTPLEALVVDTGMLLAEAGKAGVKTRKDMLKALVEAELTKPVAGTHGIDAETHHPDRELLILSLSEDAIVPRAELPESEIER